MPGNLALAIESSNPSAGGAGVAIANLGKNSVETLDLEALRASSRHSDDLMPAIDRVCARLGVGARDFDLVAVSVGPGGYTGLRIAIVTAQAIAEISGATCVGVESDRVVAQRVERAGGPFGVCLASKGASTFVRIFDPDRRARGAGRLIGADDVDALGVELLVADRFLPEAIRKAAIARDIQLQTPSFDPIALLEVAVGEPRVGPEQLMPIYPREPDAVTQWRARKGADLTGWTPPNCG
jgi:tRNA threonylcarbamoyladenosine biosynthesis protein TsaB